MTDDKTKQKAIEATADIYGKSFNKNWKKNQIFNTKNFFKFMEMNLCN